MYQLILVCICMYLFISFWLCRLCVLRSVDNSVVTAHCVHEFDPSSRSRRYVVTGHANGALQVRLGWTFLVIETGNELADNHRAICALCK